MVDLGDKSALFLGGASGCVNLIEANQIAHYQLDQLDRGRPKSIGFATRCTTFAVEFTGRATDQQLTIGDNRFNRAPAAAATRRGHSSVTSADA
jgi:hypothetical protein